MWRYNTTGEIPWLARQICMGEMCNGLKDNSNAYNSWSSRGNYASYPQHPQSSSHDQASCQDNKFYQIAAWKQMFCNSNLTSSQHLEGQNSDNQENQNVYTVICHY